MRLPRIDVLCWICSLCLWAALGAHAQALQVGRIADSALEDLGERVMREASRRTGIAMHFQNLPLQRALAMVSRGEIDADLLRTKYAQGTFPNLIRLNVPVFTNHYAAYGRTADIRAMDREAVRRVSFGVPQGMGGARKLVEGLKVGEGLTYAALFDMLDAGHFDVVVMPYMDAEFQLRQARPPAVYVWPRYWGSVPLYFVLNKKHQALVAPLEQALAQMEHEGVVRHYYAEMLKARGIEALKN